MTTSQLHKSLLDLSVRSASSVVARGRIASPALNASLLRRLSAAPGEKDSLLADPIFEVAHTWESADCNLDNLSGNLLHPDLVTALDEAKTERMPRDRHPWSHQLAAWEAASQGRSCLISSGTGSGKTECFMIPMLDDLLRDPAKGEVTGVRAIVIYPLNALIESQRERLAAWTEPLQRRFKFALYNGLTPESPRKQNRAKLAAAEIGNRRDIRDRPPAILVTNITMLEYLLLRAKDRAILEQSQGLLKWVVLDEAHSYIGAQAAEMALLLRRVRAAFGVEPKQVRLMATSATISDDLGSTTEEKLKRFTADLAGVDKSDVRVIQGRSVEPELPEVGEDTTLEHEALKELPPVALWEQLAPHPRLQKLKYQMSDQGLTLTVAARILFDHNGEKEKAAAQRILDAAARAECSKTKARLLPWRAHVFHRAQGGFWVCVNPACKHQDRELAADNSNWGFGAVWLKQRDRCDCAAPTFELCACNECGTPHLVAGLEVGASARLVPLRTVEMDDFAVDAEPDNDEETEASVTRGRVLLSPSRGKPEDRYLNLNDGVVYDNSPPSDGHYVKILLVEDETERTCCQGAANARLSPQRYGPPFFIGATLPALLEALAPPLNQPGLPMGGRRALSFSDSRQGTARLAAKLQQDAERNLTRAFLYHAVQAQCGPDATERAELERKLERFRAANVPEFSEYIQDIEQKLEGNAIPIPWSDLVNRFARHVELSEFATEVWRERARGGRELAENPEKLAEMFLYRELFRRPRVQNNAETMGLLRLAFPKLEERANATLPRFLAEKGVSAQDWKGLALSAVDFVFRDRLATMITPEWMIRLVSPRFGGVNSVCRTDLAPHDRPARSYPWPGPTPRTGRPLRLHRLVYTLTTGNWDNPVDQDRAGEVFSALWELIVSTVAKDVGGGAFQLDFGNAAVIRLDQGWLCPVTRRIFGYSTAGRSPYDPDLRLSPIPLPRLPQANSGGLDPSARVEVAHWCRDDPTVNKIRRDGLWTDLHDRAAIYEPFIRAQEHSAQIERPVLADYEERFKKGRINLLNCSTTMEMGVDIPDVQMVVNANVPPSISNYRQRVGRAGRRGEPWAFGVTYCRDLPLDRIVFENPTHLLTASVSAPSVRLDSPSLVVRHVHAALLAAFLREQPEGFDLQSSTGVFFGATDDADQPIDSNASANLFLSALRGTWAGNQDLAPQLKHLTRGTALEEKGAEHLAAITAETFETMLKRWREEYSELLTRREAAVEPEVRQAFSMRARRMKGEFLLGELARRGFTPAYGFPVDVVNFDHLSGHNRDEDSETITFGHRHGGASRTLDIAIREYAPGAEIVVDGLVHRSEGVLPAWGATADASKLEDLQDLWECQSCHNFGLVRSPLTNCPQCDTPITTTKKCLRPAGFLGRHAPHTGYENLGHAPYEMPRLSAAGAPWRALVDPEAGRLRVDHDGQMMTTGSGREGKGFALCLVCGRADSESNEAHTAAVPNSISKHTPLAAVRGNQIVRGYCPGGYTEPHRIQRNVRLVHVARTDVFELQLPELATLATGLALAAALREALVLRLGAEAREIGVAVGRSTGLAGETRVSSFLHDRASGGAGIVSRLAETEWFRSCLEHSVSQLSCSENCLHGCPACVLRPDMNFGEEQIDRPGALDLARSLLDRLQIPKTLQVFGPETRILGLSLTEWLFRRQTGSNLSSLTIYMHGTPTDWDLVAWPVAELFARLKSTGVKPQLALESGMLTDGKLELAQKLDLHRLSAHASLAHTSELPVVGGAPVLAMIRDSRELTAVATPSANEAAPGPDWGLGAEVALVHGVISKPPATKIFSSGQLVTLSSGNAQLIRACDRLNGPVGAFGRTFWKLLAEKVPLVIASLQSNKIDKVIYTDRYLLSPIALRLLFEVLRTMPGLDETDVAVSTARLSKPGRQGWAVFHNFSDDTTRRKVLEGILPDARINICDKTDLPHARSFSLHYQDDRVITILLDQGFGAWRAVGAPKHDFRTEPAIQARLLKSQKFKVVIETGREAPIVVEDR